MAFLYLGGGALLLGIAVGALGATSARRGQLLAAAGALVAIGFIAVVWMRAREDNLACHDCSELFGRYAAWALIYFFAAVNWFGWAFGVAAGAAMRGIVRARRELRAQRGPAPRPH